MIKTIILAACLLPVATMAQTSYTINGKIGNLNAPAKAYLRYGKDVDSAELKDGRFKFTGKVEGPTYAILSLKHVAADTSIAKLRDYQTFYLENATMQFNAADSIKKAIIKGSTVNADQQKLTAALKSTTDGIKALTVKWTGIKKDSSNAEAYDKAAGELRQFQADQKKINEDFIAANPNSYIALVAFRNTGLGYNFNPIVAEEQFNKFSNNLQTSALGKQVKETIETNKTTMVGVNALDFAQTDSSGKMVHLSDFRGKYVLVDFWASWCAPCRAENPNVVVAYNKLKGKNFEIIGVSLDDKKNAWENAINKDGLPWVQVSDLNGWKNEVAQQFGISAVPQNILVDPKGVIIAKNLRGEELYAKLDELVK